MTGFLSFLLIKEFYILNCYGNSLNLLDNRGLQGTLVTNKINIRK